MSERPLTPSATLLPTENEGGYSDTEKKRAKRLKRLAEDELGKRPPHMACLRLAAANPRSDGEPLEVWAARVFEANREALAAAAERKAAR